MSGFSVLDLKPADTPDYMVEAWLGCISWALTEPAVLEQFQIDTGNRWTPGRNGLEQAIDKATGADVAFLTQFIQWVNANVWGPIDGPVDE